MDYDKVLIKKKKLTKKEKRAQREEDRAVARLRFLLVRVWFIKNWFTLFVMFSVAVLTSATAGLIPETMPVLGPYSNYLKVAAQDFLEIGDSEFYSLFGSMTGAITLLWGIGYASSKVKLVSYYMIDKNKLLKYALSKGRLSIDERGRITSIEKRLGIDLDGDRLIGNEPSVIESRLFDDNIISDMIDTVSELSTILNVEKDTIKDAIKEDTGKKVDKRKKDEPAVDVVVKKPAKVFKPSKL